MTCALMPSRRKMCAKLCITVVVPAPEEPVTAMIGCFTDMWGFLEPTPGRASARGSRQRLGPEQRALVERSEEHTSELQSPCNLVCRLLLEKKNDPPYRTC